ncbi:hypothetical protein E2562_000472 [Oryza meyeriana var. granulata]|uniref:Uncharacterized protein n=1 Tax=Oryza meyeriana var. granulata TaxID=110450 RepID=A0A6G1CCI9_9ORYZ|nr:hypothetical protein E2562_000472 [Oryza meyeriana var. granulata]
MDMSLQAKNMNQSQRNAEESIGTTELQKPTTFAHGGAQIMEEPTGFGQQADTVNNVQQNQEVPTGFNQQQPDLAHGGPQIPEEAAGFGQQEDAVNNVQQNQEEPIGFNQQHPDLAHGGPQIPEEVAADPNEDVNDVFEFALNNSILDLD